ncbi:MAG: outer membrane protein, nutrient binding [Bacteroidetes bacterium]|nr:outer membrane protein, nutrient binding [Bacteroidota bacterium]
MEEGIAQDNQPDDEQPPTHIGCDGIKKRIAPINQKNCSKGEQKASHEDFGNGVYDALQSGYVVDYYLMTVECYSDDFDHTGTYTALAEAWGNDLSASNSYVTSTWRYNYRVINRANSVISGTAALDTSIIDDDTKASIIAQAKSLRALTYFKLVNLYGAVPLQLDPLASDLSNINLARTDTAVVYDTIVSDLKSAIPSLSELTSSSDQFYANKDFAYGLLSKVYLYLGEYDSALVYADRVLANTSLGLVDDYSDLWTTSSNLEGLLRIDYTSSDNNYLAFFFDADNGGRYEIAPSDYLYAAFDDSDDVRKDLISTSTSGYVLSKYNDVSTGIDKFYILRLAEIYLIAAEASAELGDYATATTYYNIVRARAGADTHTLTTSNWKSLIFNERRLELFGEGQRWLDLKRSGLASTYIAEKASVTWDDISTKYLKWPIPQDEIDANSAISDADQNDGY